MVEEKKQAKLLLVDDEEDFRQAASRALQRQGFAVSQAESGERALEMLAQEVPDVVVLDLRMAGLGGIGTLERLRKNWPELPVLILTGHGRYEDALAGIHLQVIDFVQKPVEMEELAARIRDFLAGGRRRPLREKSIAEVMVPASRYRRVFIDQNLREVVRLLVENMSRPQVEGDLDQGRRTLLVYDREENFQGLVRAVDVVRVMIPEFLLHSPYSSYFTGMFLAQSKVVGNMTLEKVLWRHPGVDIRAPLMEAVYLMVIGQLSHLPVMENGRLVGILRPEDLFREIAAPILA